MEELNLLFTSVGRRSYLIEYFKEALDGKGLIHVANSDEHSPAFLVADRFVVTPLIYDDSYIPFLLEYCKKHKIGAVISLFDIDLPILAANKNLFQEIGTQVIVSGTDVTDICNDKWNTYHFLLNHNFHAPKTYIELDKAKRELREGKLTYPVFVKPRWGMGSIAVFEAENEEELDIFYQKVMRNIQKTYLKYESAADINACVLIQEKLPGQEHGLDIINDLNGQYQNTIVKKKGAMRSGETDCAITVNNPALEQVGKTISSLLKHIGNLDCDVFWDGERAFVLELNARFGGGYPFSHLAGVNLPKAIVNWLLEKPVEKSLLQPEYGVYGQKDIRIIRLN